jgi:hypothetical protein
LRLGADSGQEPPTGFALSHRPKRCNLTRAKPVIGGMSDKAMTAAELAEAAAAAA